jgi:peptidoglycan/xylan/chitin deacetylase (PgdA/CDA1 family)
MLARLKQILGPQIWSGVPLDIWHRLLDVDLLLPHWHLASDDNLPHIRGLYKYRTVAQFKSDIEFFLRSYVPVSLMDVVRHLDASGTLPKRCFLPTFDDGFREIYDHVAPILHRHGVPAVFFLITTAVDNNELCYPHKKSLLLQSLSSECPAAAEREMSRILLRAGVSGSDLKARIRSVYYRQRRVLDELALILGCDFAAYVRTNRPYLASGQVTELMRSGFNIGGHSVDHPLYSELGLHEQLTQTKQSIDSLSAKFNFNCQAFAFPYMDLGVSRSFFERAFAPDALRVTFGTGGMRRHFFPRNLSRFTMENSDLPAREIVADAFAKSLFLPQRECDWVRTPTLGVPASREERG